MLGKACLHQTEQVADDACKNYYCVNQIQTKQYASSHSN